MGSQLKITMRKLFPAQMLSLALMVAMPFRWSILFRRPIRSFWRKQKSIWSLVEINKLCLVGTGNCFVQAQGGKIEPSLKTEKVVLSTWVESVSEIGGARGDICGSGKCPLVSRDLCSEDFSFSPQLLTSLQSRGIRACNAVTSVKSKQYCRPLRCKKVVF